MSRRRVAYRGRPGHGRKSHRHSSTPAVRTPKGPHRECCMTDQGPRRPSKLVVVQSKDLGETGVAEVAARALAQVFSHPPLTPIRKHIDPERTRGFVQVGVLTVPLITTDISLRRLQEASAMAPRDADGLVRNAAVEWLSAISHERNRVQSNRPKWARALKTCT